MATSTNDKCPPVPPEPLRGRVDLTIGIGIGSINGVPVTSSRYSNKPEPVPPGHHAKLPGHHWLEQFNGDNQSFGLIVLQWQPRAKRWCSSGNIATGIDYPAGGFRYVCECQMPTDEQEAAARERDPR